jgi:hypothetical protein
MQRKSLLKLVVIVIVTLVIASALFMYVSGSIHETFLCNKSVSLKEGENTIIEFYMPQGRVDGIKFDFSVSSGKIKYWAEPSSHFDNNSTYFKEFIDEMISVNPDALFEVGTETHGGGWTICAENPEQIIAEEYANQNWYIYLLNEDIYDKEIQIGISKYVELW